MPFCPRGMAPINSRNTIILNSFQPVRNRYEDKLFENHAMYYSSEGITDDQKPTDRNKCLSTTAHRARTRVIE